MTFGLSLFKIQKNCIGYHRTYWARLRSISLLQGMDTWKFGIRQEFNKWFKKLRVGRYVQKFKTQCIWNWTNYTCPKFYYLLSHNSNVLESLVYRLFFIIISSNTYKLSVDLPKKKKNLTWTVVKWKKNKNK